MAKKKKPVQIKLDKKEQIPEQKIIFEMKLTNFFAIITFLIGITLIFYGNQLTFFFNNLTKIQQTGFFFIYMTILAAHIVGYGRTFQNRKLHQKVFQRLTILCMFLFFPILDYISKHPEITDKRLFDLISIDHLLLAGIGISLIYTLFRVITFIMNKINSIITATEGKPTDRITITIAIFGTIISVITLFK